MRKIRHVVMSGAAVLAAAGAVVTAAGPATASTTVRFQVPPAPFGNPNGSFGVPAIRCVGVVGAKPGVITITGGDDGRWGCTPSTPVHWINLSTGVRGSAKLSHGLHGNPPTVDLRTGPGSVVVTVTPSGITVPGFLSAQVR